MDAIVEKTLADALAQIQAAAFAIETVAHMRGMERALLPIAEALRTEQTALQSLLNAAAVVPAPRRRRGRPDPVLPDPPDEIPDDIPRSG